MFEYILYVSIRNKVIYDQLNINDKIPIETCNVYNANITEPFFKDALLLSLYNQVDYLRKELDEKNEIIKSLLSGNTVSTDEVDFLRNELNEKNFLLRTITIKDSQVYAGVYKEKKPDEICDNIIIEPTNLPNNEFDEHNNRTPNTSTSTSISQTDDTPRTVNAITHVNHENKESPLQNILVNELAVKRRANKQQWMNEQLTLIREVKHINFIHNNVQTQLTNKGISNENDETVKENENEREGTKNNDDTALWPKNTRFITGDSMLCGIEEKRLSRKH